VSLEPGLFVFAGTFLLFGLLASQKAFDKAPVWLIGFGISFVMMALMVLSIPEDRQVITDIIYDRLKQQMSGGSPAQSDR
jgi:hypothetical protein